MGTEHDTEARHPDDVVCVKCGRVGRRKFVALYGLGDGRDQWVCESTSACVKRQHISPLRRERDDLLRTLQRVVANESNHYDRYWTPAPEPLTGEWLNETEAKMREALEDAFCDDAAAVMLMLIAEIRRLRLAVSGE